MKKVIVLLLFPVLAVCCGNKQQQTEVVQSSETDVIAAVDQLVKGMVDADESILTSIAADALVYGHSGGKVQNKAEFIAEVLSNQPLDYIRIELLDQTVKMSGDAAVVRHIFTAETKNPDGTPGSLRVGNTLVWQLQDGKWTLLARQAYRL